ncbi:hypothetical protein DFH09DRAFT_1114343 [Mycena vulgaris]|nr:hypothetical protein DFH09DRAFT_1114343 [Mycena vulgaris]
MQPCLEAQFGKILGNWLDLESTESTGVEVATATSKLKTMFTATRGNSKEEDETKIKEDSYIRFERKERANAALIRNMAAPATETQRPSSRGNFFLHQSFGGPPTPLESSSAFYILRCRSPHIQIQIQIHVVEGISAAGAAFLILLPTPHAYLPLIIILVDTFPISLVTQTLHSKGKTRSYIIQPTAFSDRAGDGFWSECSLSHSSLRCSRAIYTELGDSSWGLKYWQLWFNYQAVGA